jgi:hypothetical protein
MLELQDKSLKISHAEEKKIKNEEHIQDLWDIIKRSNVHITGIPKEKEIKVKGMESLFHEITAENLPILGKIMDIQEVYRTPNRYFQNRSSL